MEKRRYALLGFILVIIIGFIAFRACTPQAVVPENVSQKTQSTSPSSPKASGSGNDNSTQKTDEVQKSSSEDTVSSNPAGHSNVEGDSTKSAVEETASHSADQSVPAAAENTADSVKIVVPSFDVLRVEPDGDVVIAGRAAAQSMIEVVSGSTILGTAQANENGDFVIIFDSKLKAGDYQLVLRATGPDGKVATSLQTAIVSVPQTDKGELLALVEEPGQASRMISLPHGKENQEDANNTSTNPDGNVVETEPVAGNNATTSGQTDRLTSSAEQAAEDKPISVEAVEIEGDTIYVAGQALLGKRVNVYANDIILGSSEVSAEKRFLVRSKKPLEVGDYIIRADLLDDKNVIIATARVPFHREAGEHISAVAPNKAQTRTEILPNTDTANLQDRLSDGQQADADALERAHGSIIIRKGDNLWTISKRNYGRGTRFTTIYSANRDQIKNPDLIWPGQVFTMPEAPLSDDETTKVLNELAH